MFQFNGVPVQGGIRFQWNVQLKRFDAIDVLTNVSEGVFPILWTDQVGMSQRFPFFPLTYVISGLDSP